MRDPVTGILWIGMAVTVSVTPEAHGADDAWRRIYPELPIPFERHICYACWLAPYQPAREKAEAAS